MYRDLSPRWRWINRVAHSLSWLSVVGAGVAASLLHPVSISSGQPGWMSPAWPVITLLGGILALIGTFRGDYWMEAGGAFVAAAGVSVYPLTVWTMVASGEGTRLTQAFSLTAVVLFMIGRAVVCMSQAYRVRIAYENPPEV